MIESFHLRDLLLPELETELEKTRKILGAIPDGHNDFKPHEKSMSFSRLAGHTAEMPSFITFILTSPDIDMAAGSRTPLFLETKQQNLAAFNDYADKAITALKDTSDEVLQQHWNLSARGHQIFSGSRYAAYRARGLNHMIHHRAQLGVYLRLLNQAVPGNYGPSADEK